MYDVLAALNAALIPMSALFLWVFIDYQYKSRNDDQNTPLAKFGWSLFFVSCGMFLSSALYFLWDYEIIYKSQQMKLSIIPRALFVSGLACGFRAMDIRWHKTVFILAASLALGVLICRVMW